MYELTFCRLPPTLAHTFTPHKLFFVFVFCSPPFHFIIYPMTRHNRNKAETIRVRWSYTYLYILMVDQCVTFARQLAWDSHKLFELTDIYWRRMYWCCCCGGSFYLLGVETRKIYQYTACDDKMKGCRLWRRVENGDADFFLSHMNFKI